MKQPGTQRTDNVFCKSHWWVMYTQDKRLKAFNLDDHNHHTSSWTAPFAGKNDLVGWDFYLLFMNGWKCQIFSKLSLNNTMP